MSQPGKYETDSNRKLTPNEIRYLKAVGKVRDNDPEYIEARRDVARERAKLGLSMSGD